MREANMTNGSRLVAAALAGSLLMAPAAAIQAVASVDRDGGHTAPLANGAAPGIPLPTGAGAEAGGWKLAQGVQLVEATFRVDTGGMEIAVTWSAVPVPGQDLPPEAWAMQEGVYGPVTELFIPGEYDVTGDAGDTVFFGRVRITLEGPNDFVIPPSAALSPAGEDSTEGHFCPGPDTCPIEDVSGLSFTLPAGWRSDAPFLAETAGGSVAAAPTATFMGPDGSPLLLLNPLRWMESNGPCTDSPAGALCIFGPPDGAALAGLAVILPGLAYQAAQRD